MSALQWIVKEAKKLKKEYPKRYSTWREYVAQASAIYAKKHKGKSPVGKKKTLKQKYKAVKKTAKKRVTHAKKSLHHIKKAFLGTEKTHKDTKSHNVKINLNNIGSYNFSNLTIFNRYSPHRSSATLDGKKISVKKAWDLVNKKKEYKYWYATNWPYGQDLHYRK